MYFSLLKRTHWPPSTQHKCMRQWFPYNHKTALPSGAASSMNWVDKSIFHWHYQQTQRHTLPKNGTRWCSQSENMSISFTITSSSWSSSKMASLRTSVEHEKHVNISNITLIWVFATTHTKWKYKRVYERTLKTICLKSPYKWGQFRQIFECD